MLTGLGKAIMIEGRLRIHVLKCLESKNLYSSSYRKLKALLCLLSQKKKNLLLCMLFTEVQVWAECFFVSLLLFLTCYKSRCGVTFANRPYTAIERSKYRMACIRLLWIYITAVLRGELVWSHIHLVIHSGQTCTSKRFLGSGLVCSLKMYH